MFITRLPIAETLKNNKKAKHKMPISLLIFFFINLFIGLNLGFKKYLKKQVRPLTTVFQLLVTVVVTGVLLSSGRFFYFSYGIQYILCVLILQFSNYNLYNLIQDTDKIDINIMQLVENKVGILATVWLPTWFLCKSFLCSSYCAYNPDWCVTSTLPENIICMCSFVVDGLVVIKVCVNYYIYRSVKYLKDYLETSKINMQHVVDYYISVVDCYDNVMPLYGKLVFVEMMIAIPRLMYMLWCFILLFKQTEHMWIYTGHFIYMIHVIINFCCPAIAAEMINCQMEDIKRMLHDVRVTEKDGEKQLQVSYLLRYMDTRDLQYRVCYVIPVDLRLVVTIFSICITYFIVIIQFTHLV